MIFGKTGLYLRMADSQNLVNTMCLILIRHLDALAPQLRYAVASRAALTRISRSDNYRSGICMAIIEIGRREESIRRLARAHSANGNDRLLGSSLG